MNGWTRLMAGSLGTLAVAAVYVSPTVARMSSGRRIFPVLTRIEGAQAVALTFDDGPDRTTAAVLNTLSNWNATATFFVLGEQVERSPGLVEEILAAGHEIGIHGHTHRHHLRLTPGQVRADLRRARETIESVTGRRATLYRAPHGIFSLASWREADRLGWHRVLWSRAGDDWRSDATRDSIVARVGTPEAGDIVLLHDSDRYSSPGCAEQTIAALPRILDGIGEQGLPVRSIGSMLVASSV